MEQRRIILTNLNPSVYTQKYLSTFLTELVIHSLLYEQVLIREGDLICNRNITKHISDPDTFKVFEELLEVGAVKILRLDPKSLASNLRIDPDRNPLSARAQDHELRRSYKGRQWKPKSWERKLYNRLDDVLRDSPAYQLQRPFPKKNDFADKLKMILVKRHKYHLQERHPFHDIDDNMAKEFIAFCRDPEEWVRFLRRNGNKNPILGPEGGFYRTAGYQCLQFFERPKGMQRLLESTYASCECDREDADGRYGRSALAELPFAYDSDAEQQVAAEMLIKMEVVPVASQMAIEVTPGIGEVVAAAREHSAFRDMQNAIRSPFTPDAYKKTFNYAWESLCEIVAENWARKMVRQELVDQRITQICMGIYLSLSTLGFVVLHGPKGIDWKVLVDYIVTNRIEHWGPALSRSIRAMTKLPANRKQWVNALTLRCTRVTTCSESEKGCT